MTPIPQGNRLWQDTWDAQVLRAVSTPPGSVGTDTELLISPHATFTKYLRKEHATLPYTNNLSFHTTSSPFIHVD